MSDIATRDDQVTWRLWSICIICSCVSIATYALYAVIVYWISRLSPNDRAKLKFVAKAVGDGLYKKFTSAQGIIGTFFLFMCALVYKGTSSTNTVLVMFFINHFYIGSLLVTLINGLKLMYATNEPQQRAKSTGAERQSVDDLYK